MSLMNPKAKPKVIRSAPYNHYVQEINRRFKKLEQEGDDKKLSTAVPYLLDKLNELKNAQRHPEDVWQIYAREFYQRHRVAHVALGVEISRAKSFAVHRESTRGRTAR